MGGSRWHHALYAYMRGDVTAAGWARLGLAALWLVSQLYRVVSTAYAFSYTCGLRRGQRLPCRVVSIGNLTLGGTGKTPLTMWVARWYQQQGWRVAVLSRGYGGHATANPRVVSRGDGPVLDWYEVGDEPYLLAKTLPGVPVLVGKDRYRSGRYACERFGTQVLVLDDGFQHHALQRDLDIVLIDATNPFGHGTLLPRGTLRESLRALHRADVFVLTRTELAADTLQILSAQLRRWQHEQPIYHMTTVLATLWQGETCVPGGMSWLQQRRLVAFAGIGNPRAFATALSHLGTQIAALLVFPDHHPYTPRDWQAIVDVARLQDAACLVTTAKDAVRLDPSWPAPVPVYIVRIDVAMAPGEGSLQQQLQSLVSDANAR